LLKVGEKNNNLTLILQSQTIAKMRRAKHDGSLLEVCQTRAKVRRALHDGSLLEVWNG